MFFHVTRCEYIDDILKNGLKINQYLNFRKTFTHSNLDWAIDAYGNEGIGRWPIFLSKDILWDKISSEIDDQYCILQVDISGLKIAADIPSLMDHGGYIDFDGDNVWWKEGTEPSSMVDVLIDGQIDFHDLIYDMNAISSAIQTTGTLAVLEDIPTNKISVIDSQSIKLAHHVVGRTMRLKNLNSIS